MREEIIVATKNNVKSFRDRLLKQIGKVAVIVAIIGIAISAVKSQQVKNENMTNTIQDAMKAIGELATYEYTYHDEANLEEFRQLGGFKIPFTKHSMTIPYDGVIKVGYRISDIDVRVRGKEITIKLPEVEILNNDLDIDYENVKSDNNIFNPIEPNELGEWKENEQKERLRNAEEMGIYASAETSAREQIRAMLEDIDGYHVNFK